MKEFLGLIGKGLEMLGGTGQNRQNWQNSLYMNNLQFEQAQELQRLANAGTESLYHSLYSPKAKVRQLKEAGLSTALMYGGGGMSGTSSTSGATAAAPNTQVPQMQNIAAGLGLQIAQIANLNAQTENIEKDTENKDIENQFKPFLLSQEVEAKRIQNMIGLNENRKKIVEIKSNELELSIQEALKDITIQQGKNEEEKSYWDAKKSFEDWFNRAKENNYADQKYSLQVALMTTEKLLMTSQKELNNALKSLNTALKDKTDAEKSKIEQELTYYLAPAEYDANGRIIGGGKLWLDYQMTIDKLTETEQEAGFNELLKEMMTGEGAESKGEKFILKTFGAVLNVLIRIFDK